MLVSGREGPKDQLDRPVRVSRTRRRVRNTWCRRPSSWSNRHSSAPGCGRSRLTVMRHPSSYPAKSTMPVSSATSAPSRSVPFWSKAGCQRVSGSERIAPRPCSVTAYPTENRRFNLLLAQGPDMREEGLRGSGAVGADQDLGAVPASVGDLCGGIVQHRDVIGGGVGSGVAESQSARHGLARFSRGSRAADESRSRLCKWARPPVSAACIQATSRAEARAARSEASAAPPVSASNRQAVGVETTGPNTSPWSRSTARSAIASPPSSQTGGIGKIRQQTCARGPTTPEPSVETCSRRQCPAVW
ncbi:hypothetical protein SVIOM74S_02093 [Streptomyces violarus]